MVGDLFDRGSKVQANDFYFYFPIFEFIEWIWKMDFLVDIIVVHLDEVKIEIPRGRKKLSY